jgi:hypothetical protein
MTTQHDLKRLIRERMSKTGESYATARRHLRGEHEQTPAVDGHIKGWSLQGTTPHAYELTLEPNGGPSGGPCARIRARAGGTPDWTTLTQHFLADEFRGTRLRFSAQVRAADLADGCALWMRLDRNTEMMLFYELPGVRGDEGWSKREIVLDVDDEITLVSFGLTVRGTGTAWIADVAVERVGPEVPTTASRSIPRQPVNLGFRD